MPVTQITKPVARMLGAQVETLLQEFCEKNGLSVRYAGGTFSSDSMVMKLSIRTLAATTVDGASTASGVGEPSGFVNAALMLGLPGDCFGKTFLSSGIGYQIVDIQTNRPKYPVTAKRHRDGRTFKFPVATVLKGYLK